MAWHLGHARARGITPRRWPALPGSSSPAPRVGRQPRLIVFRCSPYQRWQSAILSCHLQGLDKAIGLNVGPYAERCGVVSPSASSSAQQCLSIGLRACIARSAAAPRMRSGSDGAGCIGQCYAPVFRQVIFRRMALERTLLKIISTSSKSRLVSHRWSSIGRVGAGMGHCLRKKVGLCSLPVLLGQVFGFRQQQQSNGKVGERSTVGAAASWCTYMG